jgi:two-component sensor histidine kinase
MFEKILNSGNKANYASWEILISRKLNFNSIVGLFNMIVGLPVFVYLGFHEFVPLFLYAITTLLSTILVNRYLNYIWGAYCFFLGGYIFLTFICLYMGKETYIILFFFPMVISIVQMFGRKELFKHLFILSFFLIVSLIFLAVGLSFDFLKIKFDNYTVDIFLSINLILSFLTTVSITLMTVKEQLTHEDKLRRATEEKELLLAEVFHRVKNNLNIVTSLLNLKKNMSSDPTVQEAIEECRSRIYSMALVHETIFNNKKEIGLKFNEYVRRLLNDVANGMALENTYEIQMDLDEVDLSLTTAVPCGMIINEVITNAFKHARTKDDLLKIEIKLKKEHQSFSIELRDNGPGMKDSSLLKRNSLGMELISSLAEQINTTGEFYNDKGLVFVMKVNMD